VVAYKKSTSQLPLRHIRKTKPSLLQRMIPELACTILCGIFKHIDWYKKKQQIGHPLCRQQGGQKHQQEQCSRTNFFYVGNEVAKNINKNNAQHAIVFEAVALALAMEADTELLQASVSLLGKFISVREPNIKYLGLENMVRLAEVPAVIDTIHRLAWLCQNSVC
jgi:signal transduction histidine kinase